MVLDLSFESTRVNGEGTKGSPSALFLDKCQARSHLSSFKNEQIEKLN